MTKMPIIHPSPSNDGIGPRPTYKCPIHKSWLNKGVCDPCRLLETKKQRERELLTGSNKPPVKIGKL